MPSYLLNQIRSPEVLGNRNRVNKTNVRAGSPGRMEQMFDRPRLYGFKYKEKS